MLTLNKIEFSFPDNRADFHISLPELAFKQSEITCILGRNGSGKTTILNMIGGHLFPDKGGINLYKTDITHLKAALRPTSTVFQHSGLFPHLTVQQNIEIAIEPNRLFYHSAKAKQNAIQILKSFDLSDIRERKPHELSIGQQQKAAIARALSQNPMVLLLDEPTSALDYINVVGLKQTLSNIKNEGIVPFVIIVSHDLNFVMGIADEIKLIDAGKLIFEGSTNDFRASQYFVN